MVRRSAGHADSSHMDADNPTIEVRRNRPPTATYRDRHAMARYRDQDFPATAVPWERLLCLNLDGVFLDVSALRELVVPLARGVRGGAYGPAALMVATSDEGMADVLEALAVRHDLAMFITRSVVTGLADARPVGALTSKDGETLDLVRGLGGQITSAALAQSIGIEVSAAGNRLTSLSRKGYLYRRRRAKREGDVYIDPRGVEAGPPKASAHPSAAVPLEMPQDVSAAVREFADAQGEQPGELLLRAWQEFTERHAGAMQDVSERAGRLMAAGDREGLADLANTHARDRARAAAGRASGDC